LWQLFNAMTMHRTTKWGATPYEESTVGIQGIRDVQGCLPLPEAAVLIMKYPKYMAMRDPSQAHHILVGASPGTFYMDLQLCGTGFLGLEIQRHWILTYFLEAKRSTLEDCEAWMQSFQVTCLGTSRISRPGECHVSAQGPYQVSGLGPMR
jgi:hypothetical protein